MGGNGRKNTGDIRSGEHVIRTFGGDREYLEGVHLLVEQGIRKKRKFSA